MDAEGDFFPERQEEKLKMRRQQRRQKDIVREQVREMEKWKYPSHSSFIVDLNADDGQQEQVDAKPEQIEEKLPMLPQLPPVTKTEIRTQVDQKPVSQSSRNGWLRRHCPWILAVIVMVLFLIALFFMVAKVVHLERSFQILLDRFNETSLECEFESNFTLTE